MAMNSAFDAASLPRATQRCINAGCQRAYPVEQALVDCPACGWLVDVVYDWGQWRPSWSMFEARSTASRGVGCAEGLATPSDLDASGVWRFRELLPFFKDPAKIVTVGEGRTNLQHAHRLAGLIGLDVSSGGSLHLQYEGFNPSGSF